MLEWHALLDAALDQPRPTAALVAALNTALLVQGHPLALRAQPVAGDPV